LGVAGKLLDPAHLNFYADASEALLSAEPGQDSDADEVEVEIQLSFFELLEHLKKFETNGEEIYKLRHLIQQHLD